MLLKPPVNVLNIQRMSTEDGPGLRTTLFLKGCNLRCAWCHNPESIDARPVVQWNKVRCIGCRSCNDVCQNGALRLTERGIFIAAENCSLCLDCVEECPSGSLNVKGEDFEVEKLFTELLKDRAYFGEDGGVTISGGEPLLQPEAVTWLLEALKKTGINTALDTAGLVNTDLFLRALQHADLLLYDIKLMDDAEHRRHTGGGNARILDNLVKAAPFLKESGKRLWIRTPVIPGATDSKENIRAIAVFLAGPVGDAVERWELCAFNNLCLHKYESLGRDWAYKDTALVTDQAMNELLLLAASELKSSGIELHGTGSTRSTSTSEE